MLMAQREHPCPSMRTRQQMRMLMSMEVQADLTQVQAGVPQALTLRSHVWLPHTIDATRTVWTC